jgi:hypothetical protein
VSDLKILGLPSTSAGTSAGRRHWHTRTSLSVGG